MLYPLSYGGGAGSYIVASRARGRHPDDGTQTLYRCGAPDRARSSDRTGAGSPFDAPAHSSTHDQRSPQALSATREALHEPGGPAADTAVETPAEIAARSPLELFWRRLRRDRVAMVALVFIGVLVLVALLAPVLVKLLGARPPAEQNVELFADIAPPEDAGPHWTSYPALGTDALGRDILSRVLYGARISLQVAFISTAIIVVVGTIVGMIAGYYRGVTDTVISRGLDIILAFPVLLLALGLGAACSFGDGCIAMNFTHVGLVLVLLSLLAAAAVIGLKLSRARPEGAPRPMTSDLLLSALPLVLPLGVGVWFLLRGGQGALISPGLPVVIFVIAIAGVPYIARIIRGQVLSLREKEFVEAARSLGATDTRIIFRHILPNLVAPIIVYTTLIIPTNILFEAALSFLGVGVQPPTPSWGSMIAEATGIFDIAWWYMTFPGLALLLTVLAFNLVGDGLQDALNPKSGR
jgi:ABC-type dipeptide/oligopeptide/nickel transport system permease subunit